MSSRYTDHRIEIWQLSTRALTKTIGPCPALVHKPGVTPAHATLLRYDYAHKEFVTLDAYTGEFQVFSVDGTLLRHAQLDNPHRGEIDKSLAEADQLKRAAGNTVFPLIWSFPNDDLHRRWVGMDELWRRPPWQC